jgi:hypothetical protein
MENLNTMRFAIVGTTDIVQLSIIALLNGFLVSLKVSVKTGRPGFKDRRQLQGQEGSPNKYHRFTNYISRESLEL